MALKVGELVAFIRADSTQFDQTVDQSEKRFKGFRDAVSGAARIAGAAFVAATSVTAGLGIAAFKVGKDFNVLQQNSRVALATILGGAEAAAEQMDRLNAFADTSPFARQVWITAQQQMLGFGVEAERIVPILDAVQQSVAAVGGSNEQIQSITFALAQMQGTGRLTGETLRRLGEYGINAADILGREWGKTGEEIAKMASKPGGIPVDQVWDPLVDGLMKSFDGAAAGLREQWDGAVDRIKAAWRDIGAILAEPFIDPMGGGRAVDWANAFADAMRAFQAQLGPAVDLLVRRFSPALDRVVPLLESAKESIAGWDVSGLNSQLDRLTKYAPLIAGTSAALFALGGNTLGLSKLGLAINPVVAGLAALVAASPQLRTAGMDFFSALSPLVPIVRDLASTAAETAMAILDRLAPAIRDLLLAAAPVIVALGQQLAPVLVTVMEAALPLVGVIADVVSWVAELPTELLLAVAAFVALNAALSGLAGPLKTVGLALLGFGQQARLQAALGETNILVGAMATASMRARGMVQTLGAAMKTAFLSNPIGLAIGAVATALAVFAANSADARARADALRATLDDLGQVTDDTARKIREGLVTGEGSDWGWYQKMATGFDSAADAIESLGLTLDEATAAVVASDEEFEAFILRIVEASDGSLDYSNTMNEVIIKLQQWRDGTADARHQQEQLAPEVEKTANATRDHTDSVDKQNEALRESIGLMRDASGNALSQREAQLRAEDAQDRFTDAVARYNEVSKDTESTDRQKESAHREVEQALLRLVGNYEAVSDAMIKNNADAADLMVTVQGQRKAFIDNAVEMGKTREEAEKLANQYGLIPERIVTAMDLDTSPAERAAQQFLSAWDLKVYQRMGTLPTGLTNHADGAIVQAYANGGINAAGQRVARRPMIAPGGANILWAEPETGWEAYISGKPSQKQRNLAILDEAARRLGRITLPAGTRPMADGGMAGSIPLAPLAPGAPTAGNTIHLTINADVSRFRSLAALESWASTIALDAGMAGAR